ncbi:unnamed protein product [Colias eurytheme]|nr:unnamed protein product [Colias eurytheme]
MKEITLNNIDFISNGKPVGLTVEENSVNSNNKDDATENKPRKPSDEVNLFEGSGENFKVFVHDRKTEENEANIDDYISDIESVINKKNIEDSNQKNNASFMKVKELLKNIKKMLKKDDKTIKNDNFKSYVPISDDLEDIRMKGAARSNMFNSGLNIINNYEGKSFLDIL